MVKYSKNKKLQNNKRKHKGGMMASQGEQNQNIYSSPQRNPITPNLAANQQISTPVSAYRPLEPASAPATKPTSPLQELTNVGRNLFNTQPVQKLVGDAKGSLDNVRNQVNNVRNQVNDQVEESKGWFRSAVGGLYDTFAPESGSSPVLEQGSSQVLAPDSSVNNQHSSPALYGGNNRKRKNTRRKTRKNKKAGKKRNNRKSKKY